MRIIVWVRSNAKSNLLTKIGKDEYRASLRATGTHKVISEALIEAAASHFSVSRAWVQIVAGQSSNRKILEIIGRSS